jgi:hypothetical protein
VAATDNRSVLFVWREDGYYKSKTGTVGDQNLRNSRSSYAGDVPVPTA